MRKRSDVVDALRQRVISARHFGTLPPDGRLPSARSLAVEFSADQRVVVAAFRALEREGVVEQRPPSRAFFVVSDGLRAEPSLGRARDPSGSARATPVAAPVRSDMWLVDVLSQALERDIPLTRFPEHARRATETLRLRAACIECNRDQQEWLCRELSEDYGVEASRVEVDTVAELAAELSPDDSRDDDVDPAAEPPLPYDVQRADILVTTTAHAAVVRALAERTGKAYVVVTQRADLTAELTRLLARGPVYFLGTDPRYAAKLRALFATWPHPEHALPVILGADDPDAIPAGSPTYVMRTARDRLGGVPSQLRVLSTRRVFSAETRTQLVRFIVRANLDAAATSVARRA